MLISTLAIQVCTYNSNGSPCYMSLPALAVTCIMDLHNSNRYKMKSKSSFAINHRVFVGLCQVLCIHAMVV